MRSLFASFAILVMLTLSGCAAPKLIHAYEGEPRPLEDVAVLVGKDNFHYKLSFVNVADLDKPGDLEWISAGSSWVGYAREVRVPPGRWIVMTKCEVGNRYGYPTINIDAVAGKTYELRCGETEKGSNQAQVLVTEVPTVIE